MSRKKYNYNTEIKKHLRVFEYYLKSKRYSKDTIRQYRNYAGLYLEWLREEGMEVSDIDYKTMTTFIFQLKKEKSVGHTRRIVLAVRHYYDSLDIDYNPASGIYIRGQKRSVLNDMIPYEMLEELYSSYMTLDDRDKRNKVLLGLLIYQGLTTGDIHQLEPRHINLKEGKLYVPNSGQLNSRRLDVQACQLLELQAYLLVIRPRMLEQVATERPGRKMELIDPKIHEKLFFSERGSSDMKPSLHHLFKAIKKTYPNVTSGKVIRSTVIAEWLKTTDIRIVQYRAGHRWVSSTERYNAYNLEALTESLKKHHPLE